MTRWLAFVMLVACGKSAPHGAAEGNPQGSAARAGDAAPAREPKPAELPAKGVAHSGIESVPRKDWPCRYVETLDSVDPGGTHIATRWEYGARTHCWLPADVAGSRALVGCPDKQVQQNLENKVEMAETYEYDAGDHLIAVQTMAARFEYAWDGDLVRGYTLRGEVHPFSAIDDGVEVKDGEDTVRVDLDRAGHVVKYQRLGPLDLEPTLFTWKGSRLTALKEIGTMKIEYDCTRPRR